jgi:hypothetical protein
MKHALMTSIVSALTLIAGIDLARRSEAAAQSIQSAVTRQQLDTQFQLWCTERKGLPESPAVCSCLSDQLHIQRLSDDGARELVLILYAVGPGSDPALEQLRDENRARLDRAAELCGAKLP